MFLYCSLTTMTIDNNTIEFLTIDDLSHLFSISKTSVYRLISQRKLPFYKIGGLVRFKKNEVLEYVEKKCTQSIG